MILSKPVISTSTRNYFGPRADRLSVCYAVDEQMGSELSNLGLTTGTSLSVPADGIYGSSVYGTGTYTSTTSSYDGEILNSAGSPNSDRWFESTEGLFVSLKSSTLGGSGYYVRVLDNNSGSAVISLRGTMMIRFSFNNIIESISQPVFSTADDGATHRLYIFRDNSTSRLKVYINGSEAGNDGQFRLSFPDEIEAKKMYTLVVTWGESGFDAWLNGQESDLTQIEGGIGVNDSEFVDNRLFGNKITTTYWAVPDGEEIRIGRDGSTYGDINLYTFCLWDVNLKQVEREELFCDAYIPIRPRAKDYSGSGVNSVFRTDVNPIPVRPRLNSDSFGNDKDEITFSVVTSDVLPSGLSVYMRVNYDTDRHMEYPSVSNVAGSDTPNSQLNVTITNLAHNTTYYYIAEYSVDRSNWYVFPGGRGKFKTQKRTDINFDFAFYADDHIGDAEQGGPPLDSSSLYFGYGGDILSSIIRDGGGSFYGTKHWLAWRAMYDIYVNQDVDFIIVGGDFYCPDNYTLYDDDTTAIDNPEKLAQSWRNWCNLLLKSGVCYFVLGNHESEAGYLQRERSQNPYVTQMRATIARKKFFPNPTHLTYPEGGENETPHNGDLDWIPEKGNDWIPLINTLSSTDSNGVTDGANQVTYDQAYRDEFILGITTEDPYVSTYDPFKLNRSPLENYYAWTWGDNLFVVLDPFRYTEPGDPLNTAGAIERASPVWTLGITQMTWFEKVLANSKEKNKFVICHHLVGGEAIDSEGVLTTDGSWYGRGSGAVINRMYGITDNSYNDGVQQADESTDEIKIHGLMKKYKVTAFIKGHDHKFCHVLNDEVNYITASTASAPGQYETTGMRNSYGRTEDQNSQQSDAAGIGIKVTSNTKGYCLFRKSSAWMCLNRLTALAPFSGPTLQNQNYTNVRLGGTSSQWAGPGWAGPAYLPDSSDQVTLSEIPWDIYTICVESDSIFSGSNNEAGIYSDTTGVVDAVNLYKTRGNDWEEFYGDNVVSLDASVIYAYPADENLHIMHVPMTTHTQTILKSVDENQYPVTLHNITPDEVIFVYNINVSGSEEVAQYYRDKRGLPQSNLVGLDMPIPNPPSSCETPITKSQFTSTILEPLRNAIGSISDSQSDSGMAFQSTVIVLGYGTPLSYVEDDGEIIAIASRLHRLSYSYESKMPNPTYDRKTFKFFGSTDSNQLFITAILDGPTVAAVKKLIDRGVDVSNQPVVTGKLSIDPYGLRLTDADQDYESDILDFVNNSASNLGLTTSVTVEIDSEDPYEEPTVAFLRGESFYWGWFEPSYSKDLLFTQSNKRVFLYNADNDSACQIHYYENGSPFQPDGSDPWCNIAINVEPGYASCAGSVDAPGSDAYLRPRPFFEALHQGASIGEAFLFASPYVNWKTVLIGDPLTTVVFPSDVPFTMLPDNVALSNNESIRMIKESIEESLAWGYRQARLTKWIREFNVESTNIAEEIELLYAAAKWENRKKIETHNNLISRAAESLVTYINATTGLTLPVWLSAQQAKMSVLLNNLLTTLGSGSVDTDNLLYPEGHWDYDFEYTHLRETFENLHFQVQMSIDSDFLQTVIDVNSFDDTTGWSYESEPYLFVQLVTSGLSSNFSGRKIRYTSPVDMYLTRGDIFHVRWRALESDGVTPVTEWYVDDRVLIIKR